MLSISCLPVVGTMLGRPAPLRLAVLSVACRLGLASARAHVATRDVATSGLWVGAVAAASAGGWDGSVCVRCWCLCAGGSVRDHNSGCLAVAESDSGGLGGVGTRARARAGARCRLRWHAIVDSLGDGDVRSARWTVGGLGDVDGGSRRASTFRRNHRSVLRGRSGNDWAHGANRLARGRNSRDGVHF
jgi:hypothetical protein